MAYSADPTLYLYTSLTAGSSHIITATSRLETILKANKIPFRALDCATDEKARMLWGRRSKGKKLPGLVKYGNVIGDLEQIEEWNEYGELKDQIIAADSFGTGAPPPPPATHPTATLPLDVKAPESKSDPPSRASSQGRHISISEPTEQEKNEPPKLKSPNPMTDNPMNMAMRQLGAEAAAKGAQRKTSATGTKAAPAPTSPTAKNTAQVPTPTTTKMSDAASEPSEVPESTAAKTPALLAVEGKTKTSTDKIEANTPSDIDDVVPSTSFPPKEALESPPEKSTEEQVLDLRRTSTQTKQPSRLSESTPAAESEKLLPEESLPTEPATEQGANVETAKADEMAVAQPRPHQESDLEEGETPVTEKKEEENETKEENEDEVNNEKAVKSEEEVNNKKAEKSEEGTKILGEQKPQATKAKDADAAGVGIGD